MIAMLGGLFLKTQIEILKEIEAFSFGNKGTLRFYHQKFQEGYLQAIKDISSLLTKDAVLTSTMHSDGEDQYICSEDPTCLIHGRYEK